MSKHASAMLAFTAIAASVILLAGCLCEKSGDWSSKIVVKPQNQLVEVGSNAMFTVVAKGPELWYQWTFNGTKIPGATNQSLLISYVKFSDVGVYQAELTGPHLKKVSDPGFLSASTSTNGGNDGVLSQVIDSFVSGSPSCASGFTRYWSFYPTTSPYGYVPPAGTTKVAVNTFDTRNNSFDTAVEIFKRPGLTSVCCNNDALVRPQGFSPVLSSCTNITTQTGSNYRFGLYAKGTIPAGTVLYLNYHFY